jgi:hypothetical protein
MKYQMTLKLHQIYIKLVVKIIKKISCQKNPRTKLILEGSTPVLIRMKQILEGHPLINPKDKSCVHNGGATSKGV